MARTIKHSENYQKLLDMYNKHGAYFIMALTHLLCEGYKVMDDITPEELQKMIDEETERQKKEEEKGKISIFKPDFIKWLWETAIEIHNLATPSQLIIFAQKEKLFDSKSFN